MSDEIINTIESEVDRLSERVRALHNGEWVALSYASGSWAASTHFIGLRSGACDSPWVALQMLEDEINTRERLAA